MSHHSRNRIVGIAGLVALVLSGGILFQAIKSRSDIPREVRVIEVQEAPKPDRNSDATPAPKVDTAPEVEDEPKEPERPIRTSPAPVRVRPQPKPPVTTPDPTESWREKPGF